MELTQEQVDLLPRFLSDLGFPPRTVNHLESIGVFTLEDLLQTQPNDLLAIQNFGEKTLEETYRILEEYGFVRNKSKKDKHARFDS